MKFLYNLSVVIYRLLIHFAAITGNEKAKQWVKGRKNWKFNLEEKLKLAGTKKRYWFHCASLGEFEQGRPLIERVRKEIPDAFIVLSFFSPSGYENRKNYDKVDCVTYLPSDSASNAKKFLSIVQPNKIIFVKYEFWYNYIHQIGLQKIPFYIVSANFRPDQIFFQSYGTFFRKILQNITTIFVQDKSSAQLLNSIGVRNVIVAGDTRFDRVTQVVESFEAIDSIANFCKGSRVLVGGSTWPDDDTVLLDVYRSLEQYRRKLILVPHEPDEKHLQELIKKLTTLGLSNDFIRFSGLNSETRAGILIIDRIGMLSKLYHYADIAYVGGGFGKGIHNILEAAAHRKPVLFGPVYGKFREAHELLAEGGAFDVKNSHDATVDVLNMILNETLLKSYGEKAGNYVRNHTGATEKIFTNIFSS